MSGSTGGSGAEASSQQPQQVLHVREDSDSQMDALFAFIKNKDQTQLQQQASYRNRRLPPSFFKPPHGGVHSREGSQEGGFPGQGVAPGTHIHIRSQSEPAQLPHNFSAPPPPPQHMKQQSVDYTNELGVLPPGWDINKQNATTGRFLTVNADQSWQDPRKSLSSTALNHQQQPHQQLQVKTTTTAINPSLAIPGLPPGWEQGITPDGEIYYINHVTKTTSWYDPRIPKNLQRPGVKLQLGGGQQQQQQLLSPPQQGTPPQQLSPGQHASAASPPGQQQVASPQQPQQRHTSVTSDQYLHLELQKIELEKERLRHEQEEIIRREQLLKDLMLPVPNGSSDPMKHSPGGATASAMQSVTSSGMDPFLGQATQPSHSLQESHARQNSADSGLGGMGTSYSLPRTPEDFLTNVEEMDSADGGHKLPQQHNMQGMTMDIGDTVDNPTMMDSEEDLVPSLQQDIGTELLNDIEIQKMDNLLWL